MAKIYSDKEKQMYLDQYRLSGKSKTEISLSAYMQITEN